jgi:hypothetical protein
VHFSEKFFAFANSMVKRRRSGRACGSMVRAVGEGSSPSDERPPAADDHHHADNGADREADHG